MQGYIDKLREQEESLKEILVSPRSVDVESLRFTLIDTRAQVNALEWALTLPKTILEEGEIAKQELKEIQ